MAEVARRGQENLAGDGGREGARGREGCGSGDGRGGSVGAAREEHDRTRLVVMSVGRVVDVFVQLGAGGEDRECQHEHGCPDRDEAVETGNESDEAWHDDDVESGGTEEA